MHLKRLFDVAISVLALSFMMPLIVVLAFIVLVNIGSPIFFTQKRPGFNGKVFTLIKFRTMKNSKGLDGLLLSDAERLNRFGRFLRASSLDELPEFWNVLKGDMSLVGPRPLLEEYLPLYSPEQLRRHDVRPGITGWAQVNGRNAISWEDKFKYDIWYVENQSFWLDMKIIWKTIEKVTTREGIYAAGETTTPKFTGNKE